MDRRIIKPLGAIAAIAFFAWLFAFSVFPLRAGDAWTHMATGKYVFEHKTVPSVNVFLYPMEGKPMKYSEWLFGLLLYAIHSLGGVDALILFKAAVVTLTFGILWLVARVRGGSISVFILLSVFTAIGMRFRLVERPEIITYLFIALYLYLFDLCRTHDKRYVYALPLVQIIWANMHPAATIGIFISGAYLVSAIINARRRGHDNTRLVSTIFGLVLLATFVTPYPLEPFMMTLASSSAQMRQLVQETHSITEFPVLLGIFLVYAVLWAATLGLLKRKNNPPEWGDSILYMAFACLPFISARALGVFAILNVALLTESITKTMAHYRTSKIPLYAALLISIAGAWAFVIYPPQMAIGLGQARGMFPEGGVRFIEQNNIPGPVHNLFEDGGYLSFHLGPKRKAFIDDNFTQSPGAFAHVIEETEIFGAGPRWQELLDQHKVNTIITKCCYAGSVGMLPLVDRLIGSDEWKLVYADEGGFVFLRDSVRNAPWLYTHTLPKSEAYHAIIQYAYLLSDGIGQNLPQTLARAHLRLGNLPEGKSALEEWLRHNPDDRQAQTTLEELKRRGY